MYHHVKKLMYTVDVGTPDPRFGNMLLEQFGGANGELAAAMQYSIQGMNCDDPGLKDLLMDIGTEELSHLEVIGALARLHLKPMKTNREAAEADPLVAIAGGGGVTLCNSMGNAWTADYLKITGELDVDLRSNIAAEARAKIVYERLINFCDDAGTKDALQFLMTREITHLKAFTLGLESLGKDFLSIGQIPPSEEVVNLFFNDSTGTGDDGEQDQRGPWNEGGDWEFIESPAFEDTARQDSVSVQVQSEESQTREKPSLSDKIANTQINEGVLAACTGLETREEGRARPFSIVCWACGSVLSLHGAFFFGKRFCSLMPFFLGTRKPRATLGFIFSLQRAKHARCHRTWLSGHVSFRRHTNTSDN